MRRPVCGWCVQLALGTLIVLSAGTRAAAQTTVTLSDPSTEVVFATLRGGVYADTNYPTILETRSSDNSSYVRRAMVKFDTQNELPAGINVTSAILTVTVKSGGSDPTRRIGAYQVKTSWAETEATWRKRRSDQGWSTAGGDLGTLLAEATAGNATGTKVSFDVTALVKAAVAGELGRSRYTRVALVDRDSGSAYSYRSYYTPRDTSALRPTLKVTYGGSSAPTPIAPTITGSTLRVLHWNTHHNGVGTDGKLDMDRFISWVAKFKPDVVSLNEVEYFTGYCGCDGPARFTQLLEGKTGMNWHYKFQTATGTSRGNGNMLLSRFPFDSTGTKLLSYDRSVVNATIVVNGRTVNLFSTHLDDDSTSARLIEIGQLKSWAAGLAEQRIIAGDFNAWPGSTENAKMKEHYRDAWAVAKAANTDISYPGNDAGNTRNSRIDYIYYSENATKLVLKSMQVYDTRDSSGVMPSDHRPILAVFQVQ